MRNFIEKFPSAETASEGHRLEERPPKEKTSERKYWRQHYAEAEEVASRILGEIKQRPSVEQKKEREEFKEKLAKLYEELDKTIDKLDADLKWQEKYGLVHHTRISRREEFLEMLRHGERAIEIDVRSTKDGVPVISHSISTKGKFGLLGQKLDQLTISELKEKFPEKLSLEEALEVFKSYANKHELVIEIKDLKAVDGVIELIKKAGVANSVRIAALLPEIIKKVHEELPDVGLIMNGGIVPYLTTPSLDKIEDTTPMALERFLVESGGVRKRGWKVAAVGPFAVVFSAGLEDKQKHILLGPQKEHEGHGEQRGYVFFRMPNKLTDILKKNPEKSAVSVTTTLIAANILKIFAPKTAQALMERYLKMTRELGLSTMATTWFEGAASVIKKLDPAEQTKALHEAGVKVIYTHKPREVAQKLRESSTEK